MYTVFIVSKIFNCFKTMSTTKNHEIRISDCFLISWFFARHLVDRSKSVELGTTLGRYFSTTKWMFHPWTPWMFQLISNYVNLRKDPVHDKIYCLITFKVEFGVSVSDKRSKIGVIYVHRDWSIHLEMTPILFLVSETETTNSTLKIFKR